MFKSLKDYPTEEIAEMVLAGCKEYADEGYSISMSTRIGNEQCITLYFSDGSKNLTAQNFTLAFSPQYRKKSATNSALNRKCLWLSISMFPDLVFSRPLGKSYNRF